MKEVSGDEIIRKAINRGCDAAEVFVKNARGLSVEVKGGKVEALKASLDFGVALRVIKKQKTGFSFTTSHEGISKIIDEAIEGAEWTHEDEFSCIPECMTSGEVSIFDKQIETLKDEDIIRDAILLEKSSLAFDERIKKVRKAEVSLGVGSTAIINSNGINVSYRSSYYSAHVSALAQDTGGDNQMGWDYAGSRRRSDVDIEAVGNEASKRAIELLGARRISAVRAPVILSTAVAVDFLEILSASLSSEAVQKQRSFLTGKVGQKIISDLVDIVDDGTMAWGTGTRPVDDEGVPTLNKILVSKGVLNGYLYNTYTARKDGVSSTGNAVRGFKGLPGVGVTNMFIKPAENQGARGKVQGSGKRDPEEDGLIKSLSRGILVLGAMGVHTANPISGDFSIGISGLWIENGETVYPVKEAVMSGNILGMFNKVEAVGSDLRFYGSTGSPSLLIGDMDISA
ncbi:MAG: TldD/PmbA family protein [Nitrospirae bacterium]|nr:TldD/PmbA family protein [Nitrospirota bacterium]